MGPVSPVAALIPPYRYGMPTRANLSSPTLVILILSIASPGHLMTGKSPLAAVMAPYKSGMLKRENVFLPVAAKQFLWHGRRMVLSLPQQEMMES